MNPLLRPGMIFMLTALTFSHPAVAGPAFSPTTDAVEAPAEVAPDPIVRPSLDLRARYEFREVDPFDPSHSGTVRARAGLLTRELAGFSAFAELEATQAFLDDYRSNPADDSTDPFESNNSVIADPENFELNQAWLQYHRDGFTGKAGRQRIIRNNAAFIAHVGWRQNEQTYDAIDLAYAADPFTVSYTYSNQALRIFGDGANDAPPGAPLRDFEGDFHFIDGKYTTDAFTVASYAYLLDIDNSAAVGRNNSFGGFVESGPWRAEVAYQDGESSLASGHYGAWYGHASWKKSFGPSTFTAGFEFLQEDFKTPFALLHAFNGFADAFAQQRAGLSDAGGAYRGLSDAYIGYGRSDLPLGLTVATALHAFGDDRWDTTYGYEADAVLSKAFGNGFVANLKGAWFFAEEGGGFADISQVTLELNYRF